MNNNYIDKIIEKWNNFNNDKYEIYLYSINDLIDIIKNDINDMIIDCDDDINDKNQLLKNMEYCKTINDNYHIVIDTPCDDDIITIIQFDKNYNIIGFGDCQTTYDEIYCNKCDNISILNDCMQFFRKIDCTGLLQHIYDNWNYYNRDDNIYKIPCNVLSNIIKTWIK